MLPASLQVPAAAVLVVGGLLACFAGYRMFRIVLGIYGFVLGALAASSLMGTSDPVPMVIAAIAGGLAGAIVLILAYFMGVALVGAATGALIVHVIFGQLARDPHIAVVIAAAVLGALAALALQRYVIIGGTAFGGAWTALWGGVTIAGLAGAAATVRDGVWLPYPMQPAPGEAWYYAAWLVLGVVGTIVQLSGGGPKARRRTG
jgi:hypothetical protein